MDRLSDDRLSDNIDVDSRRNSLIGQINNVPCYFKSDSVTKTNLLKSYLPNCLAQGPEINFYLPKNTHSFFLPILSDSIPIFDEICKRTARFISSCLFSPSRLLQSISWLSLVFGRFGSPMGNNALICCKRYNWLFDEFILNLVNLGNNLFRDWYVNRVSDIDLTMMHLYWNIVYRDGHFKFSHDFTLNKSEINDIIKAIATAWSIPYSVTCFSFYWFYVWTSILWIECSIKDK